MKVYYSFALQQLAKHQFKYQEAIDTIKGEGNIITREWLDDAVSNLLIDKPQPPRANLYQEITSAIKEADVAIFDVSVKSMSIGNQINYAIERRIPTLLLADLKISDPVERLFIAGSKSGYLHAANYSTEKEMKKRIADFITSEDITTPLKRYNFNLNHSVSKYIEWYCYKRDVSKTEVISKALEKMMENDSEYSI